MENIIYTGKDEKRILEIEEYRGYKYVIVTYGTHPCAYVLMPNGHPYAEKSYDEMDIHVHGGLTFYNTLDHLDDSFGDEKYIGWDYAHCGDYYCSKHITNHSPYDRKYTIGDIETDVKSVIAQMIVDENEKNEDDIDAMEKEVMYTCSLARILSKVENMLDTDEDYKNFLKSCLNK